jgi:S-adenosylmethionine:tRNA-ribosyltransferase-isomerase (queuine synthetase)
MRVDLFEFELPPERIALRPVKPRDSARMLVVEGDRPFADRTVRDLPQLLRKGDVLVFNDTRVIPAQVEGRRLNKDGGEAGIGHTTLTLHVGAGTFLPVKAEDTADHKMHAEWGRIDQATADHLNAVRAKGGRVIAVGTTSLRLIESAAGDDKIIRAFEGDTAIFITPGYRFKGIDGLVTNFHLPRSTLFMLVSSLMGLDRMQAAYAHAIADHYRFYSYGDASLLLP